jgi:hypothetical protein
MKLNHYCELHSLLLKGNVFRNCIVARNAGEKIDVNVEGIN